MALGRHLFIFGLSLLPLSCDHLDPLEAFERAGATLETGTTTELGETDATLAEAPPPTDARIEPEPPQAQSELGFYRPGSGSFVSSRPSPPAVETAAGEVTLNFESTNLLEVVKVILGDILQENFVVDPAVQGTVTLQTSRPLARSDLLPVLELLLGANGAALVHQNGVYNILPRERAISATLSPQLGGAKGPLPKGYRVLIVPLRYIAAREMHKILEPFTVSGNIVRVDVPRNLLILAGSGPELEQLLATVEVFDVDWLAGQSVALFTPDFVEAKTLVDELRKVFDDADPGPLSGVIRFVEIERLNAILVVSSSAAYLERAAEWVERLDHDTGEAGRRLYVYHVQNGKAEDLAAVLNQVFETETARADIPPAALAPGLEPVALESAALPEAPPLPGDEITQDYEPAQPPAPQRVSSAAGEGLELSEGGDIRIIADQVNNALLVMASVAEYKQVQAALRKLDIPPLQVLIETTIAEITLSGDLQYGLEWFFKNNFGDKGGEGTLDLGAAGLAPFAPSFSYAITAGADVRLVLNALASKSRVNVVSSPTLMVLNNQTSSINVGDEVPVTIQQQQSTSAVANVINTIQYINTGVLLTVTPRVNAGGLVTLEIEQEVSDVAPGTGDSLTPTIQQRKINSTIAVSSGHTIVLGGLIRENKSSTGSGIPVLYDLPLIGPLFGATTKDARRTELVVLITPRVVQNTNEADLITREFERKMESLRPPS